MDCEYILVIIRGERLSNRAYRDFHAPTPEEAVEQARELVRIDQAECVRMHPTAPTIVKGELYRQVVEIDGWQVIRRAK